MIFLDTSIFVAAAQSSHIHYEQSSELLRAATRKTTCCGGHSLAETYATLSGYPKPARVPLPAVMKFMADVRERVRVVTLSESDYFAVLQRMATAGHIGGIIFDAVLMESARKIGAKRIYTWDVPHFRLIAPDLANRIFAP